MTRGNDIATGLFAHGIPLLCGEYYDLPAANRVAFAEELAWPVRGVEKPPNVFVDLTVERFPAQSASELAGGCLPLWALAGMPSAMELQHDPSRGHATPRMR